MGDWRRFAILRHDHPSLHWDLLLEAGLVATTWRLLRPPLDRELLAAELLPDHRLLYLEYEGPVSGNRGCVRRVAGGQFRETRLSPSADRESLPDLVGVEGIETDVVLDVLLQLDLQHGASWKRAWLLRSQAARLFWWFD
jgi:hypothetical protein